jgi:hypothetical protein
VRAPVLAAAVFPVSFTALAVWLLTPWAPATGTDLEAAGASAVIAIAGWAGLAVFADRRRTERAAWTPDEIAAMYDTRGLRRVLDATPKRGKR